MIGRWNTSRIEEEEEKPTGFDSFDLRLGDMMRGERATMGKSLLDVQRELKIKAAYIAAIENADISAFETQGFIAGYVRSYARYLGMDPEWAYATFCEESGFVASQGLATNLVATERKESAKIDTANDPFANPNASWVPQSESIFAGIEPGAIGSLAVLAALIGVLGFGGWSVLKEIQRVDFTPIEQTPGVLAELPDVMGVGGVSGSVVTADAAATGAGLVVPPTADALDRLYRPQALDVPVLTHRDAPISTLDPRNVGVLADAAPQVPLLGGYPGSGRGEMAIAEENTVLASNAAENSGVRVFGDGPAEVTVFAVRPAWVRIQSADGTVIFEKILDAGEHYSLPMTEQAPKLRAGNAGSVYFAVNGTAYGPAGNGPTVVKDVALSQADLVDAYAEADLERDQDLATYVAELQTSQ